MICKLKKLDRSALVVINSIHPYLSKLADLELEMLEYFLLYITEPERGAKLQDTGYKKKALTTQNIIIRQHLINIPLIVPP